LSAVPQDVFREHSALFGDNVMELFDLEKSTDRRSLKGGTGRQALVDQIAKARAILTGEENS